LLSSYTSSNYAPNNTEPLYIGALNTTSGYLNGKIGMVGMYNRKLSIEEMRTLYHSTKRRFGM
jgi:hypothetical protein